MFQYPQFEVNVAKRVVVSLTVVAILSVYEFRMGSNLFTAFFGGFSRGRNFHIGLMRAGFMRIQGPYGHAMTSGVLMALGF